MTSGLYNPVDTLSIAYFQMPVIWHNPDENRRVVEEAMARLEKPVDLVMLPEMFSTGFSMTPEKVAETMDGQTVRWMKSNAQRHEHLFIGSVIIEEEGKFYNRMLFCYPNGNVEYYDKRHLFSYAGEDDHYARGMNRKIIKYKGWRILGLVCYDLRFPVWSRNDVDYDLLLYVANWPKPRIHAWNTLLAARAIENQCYVAAVNRIGEDENGLAYPGSSGIYDFQGICFHRSTDIPEVHVETISRSALVEFRKQYNFLADRDRFIVEK